MWRVTGSSHADHNYNFILQWSCVVTCWWIKLDLYLSVNYTHHKALRDASD